MCFRFCEKREVCDPDALGPKISYIRIFTTKTLQIPKEKVGTAYPPWNFPGFFPYFFLDFWLPSIPEAPIPVSFVGDRVQQGRLLISAANVSVPWVSWRNGMVKDVSGCYLCSGLLRRYVDGLQVARLI